MLITCNECGVSVSTTAKACPGCGAGKKRMKPPSTGMSIGKKIGIGFLGLFGLGAVVNAIVPKPVPTPAEIDASKAAEARNTAALGAAQAVRSSLRDPSSIEYSSIMVDDVGGLVCIVYRARNGFGGLNVDHVAYVNGTPRNSRTVWNRRCAQASLYDVTHIGRFTH